MSEIVDFLRENSKMIILIVIVVLGLLVLINMKGIDLNPPKPESKLVQEVTVETLDMMDKTLSNEKINANLASSFCESYLGNSQELEGACNQLTETNCSQTSCCVYANNKCVAGGLNGLTYNTDKDGKLITIDTYYYLGKCRGNCRT